MRTSATAFSLLGIQPIRHPDVIEIAEEIPFVALTDWDHEKLYALKGSIVSSGVRQLTGLDMPTYPKQRFQRGAADSATFESVFPSDDQDYRDAFKEAFVNQPISPH